MYIFNSRLDTLTVVLRPTRKVVVGTQVIVEEGARARFVNGIFSTDEPEIAELLRQKIKKSGDREVVEIGSEEELAFKRAGALKNQREATTAPSLSKTLNPSLAERALDEPIICPICDPEKKFKTQKDLNLHLVGHRPGITPAPDVEAPNHIQAPPPDQAIPSTGPRPKKPKE